MSERAWGTFEAEVEVSSPGFEGAVRGSELRAGLHADPDGSGSRRILPDGSPAKGHAGVTTLGRLRPSGGLAISWCGPESAQAVFAITRAAFAGQERLDPPSSATRETPELVRADLEAGRGVLGHVEDRPVAAARVLLADDRLDVRRLAVHPSFRRRGIANAIMQWLHAEAVELGYASVGLGVRKALPSNRRFYEKLGYREVADHGYWVEMQRELR